jgi:D-sedoheptulose 7-phosphate isomerase
MKSIKEYFQAEAQLFEKIPFDRVDAVVAQLEWARTEGRRIFVFGNGGSITTAAHFACDLGKGVAEPGRPRFKVIAIPDNLATLTAYANDSGYESIFAEPLVALAQPGDIAFALTASGNSANVVRAIETAEQHGLKTIAFTGFDGGKVKERVELTVHVPAHSFPMVEDVHMALTHAICEMLKLQHEPH